MTSAVALLLCCGMLGTQAVPEDSAVDRIWQFFASSGEENRPNLGAYLWIPPNTPRIRAVMVGMHNGLPINVLQSPPVRAVCRNRGIAQILMTPWAKDIGAVMMKDLTFDVTDPARTAVYQGYLQRLAEASGHRELVTVPVVPLGHSAYCGFPFETAMYNPEQCLAAIPIKAGLPDVYNFFLPGGKAMHPRADFCLRSVPILFVTSSSQETVGWGPCPQAYGTYLSGYRSADRDDNPGSTYQAHAELFGSCWEMTSGHFDMYARDYEFVADWLDAIAAARLPDTSGSPMKNLLLRDGWLVDPRIPAAGPLPKDYPLPAPYLEFKGRRNQAIWFPNEKLARTQFELGVTEPRKKIEMFTFRDPAGKPISLAHGRIATMPNPAALLHDDGLFTLTTYHFTTPPEICTAKHKDLDHHPEESHAFSNVLLAGQTTMPVSRIPLRFDAHGGVCELVRSEQFQDERGVNETRFTLRLIRHRIATGAGFNMSFVRVYHEGDSQFAAAGRTCQISLAPCDVGKSPAAQTVDFAAVPDMPASVAKIELKAKSSAGLPVDYFVLKGPGVVRGGAFIPAEVPAGTTKPIEVTLGAYQVGLFKESGGVKPAETVYRTFHLTPPRR